jgi:branched-chain amino acid aminotransferase
MGKWAFIDKEFIPEQSASVHFCDLAIQRGYGVFDFFKIVNNSPVFLDEHLDRFFYSAEQMHLPIEQTKKELHTIISELLFKNAIPDSGVRLTLTGGYSADGYQLAKPNFIISQSTLQAPSKEQFQKGIRLISYDHQRQLPHVKSIDYLMAIWLQPLLQQRQADDILYHHNGIITECPRANFFIVTKDDTIVTPQQNILKGITRNTLIKIAGADFKMEQRDVSLQEVLQAKEAFVTSTTKKILPVRSIDGRVLGETAGSITKALFNLLHHKLTTQVKNPANTTSTL